MQPYNPKDNEANAKILIYCSASIIVLYGLAYFVKEYDKQIQTTVSNLEGELEKILKR